jgi:hypothetical protein
MPGLGTARADNFIWEWGGAPPENYEIRQDPWRLVVIKAPGTYKFAASDDTDPGNLGVINLIKIQDEGVGGTVDLYVTMANEPGSPGVARLKEINLSGATEGNIRSVRARDSLADDGKIVATSVVEFLSTKAIAQDIELDYLTGTIWCKSMADLKVSAGTSGTPEIFIFGPHGGTIDVAGSLNYLVVTGALSGSVTVQGELANLVLDGVTPAATIVVTGSLLHSEVSGSPFEGNVHVGGNVGAFTVDTGFGAAGQLIVDGNLTGWLWVPGGPLAGTVTIMGSIQGFVYVGSTTPADLTGSLTVQQDMSGLVDVNGNLTGALVVNHDLTGRVNVHGNLVGDAETGPAGHIIINGSFGTGLGPGYILVVGNFSWSQAFISVDYDGYQYGDDWKEYAYIDVHGRRLTGNTPEEHVWEISGCRGDLNGDHAVGFSDLNPFVLALNSPEEYAQAFPGLQGSMVWHGDVNCNGVFGFDDISPFVALLSLPDPCCDATCPLCEDAGGQEAMSAQELAENLAANIWPELYDELLWIVAEAIKNASGDADAAYWLAVYNALTE